MQRQRTRRNQLNQTKSHLCLGVVLATFFLGPPVLAQVQRENRAVITATINDCERQTNGFVGSLRTALNRANVRYERKEDLLRSARNLEDAMDKVGDSWNRDNNPERAGEYVRSAIGAAREINGIMVRRRLNRDTEQRWNQVRRELNLLARAFNVPGLGR
jgi:hypothetical protein